MNQVFLAARRDGAFEQKVVIKIADPLAFPASARWLERERRILAELSHPGIARLLAGGELAGGRTYVVTEYVEGQSVADYCDGLTTIERVLLMRRILAAVAYAHRHLVAHLDLKPGNILVDAQGRPRLLDFGIAKLLGETDATGDAHRPLTPEFASPEQRRGERLTTASDVYSLGLLLHRLVFGHLPGSELPLTYRGNGRDRVARDVRAIYHLATRKRPDDRYPSVEALDADLERCLDGRPVRARSAERTYRARRYFRRHWQVLTLAGTLLTSTLGAAILASLQAQQRLQERNRSLLSRQQSQATVDLFARLLTAPREDRAPLTVPELLDRSREDLAGQESAPELRARAQEALGGLYLAWGQSGSAAPLLQDALDTYRRAGDARGAGNTLLSLGRLARERSDFAVSAQMLRESLDLLRRHHGELHPAIASAYTNLGDTLFKQYELASALAFYERSCAIHRRIAADAPAVATCLLRMGQVHHDLSRYDEALRLTREAIELQRSAWPDGHPSIALSLESLGRVLGRLRRVDEAEAALRRALELRETFHGLDHPLRLEALNSLGLVLGERGRANEAEELLREALEIVEQRPDRAPHMIARLRYNLAQSLGAQERYREAEPLLRQSLEDFRRHQPGNRGILYVLHGLAELLLEDGRPREAIAFAQEAIDAATPVFAADHPMFRHSRWIIQQSREQLDAASPSPPGANTP